MLYEVIVDVVVKMKTKAIIEVEAESEDEARMVSKDFEGTAELYLDNSELLNYEVDYSTSLDWEVTAV